MTFERFYNPRGYELHHTQFAIYKKHQLADDARSKLNNDIQLGNLLSANCSGPNGSFILASKVAISTAIVLLLPNSMINVFAQESSSSEKTFEYKIGEKSYLIQYRFTNGGTISDFAISHPSDLQYTLKINLTAQADGNLEITLPREVSDAAETTAAPFAMISDGKFMNIDMSRSCEQTSLVIPTKAGNEQLVLFGYFYLAFVPHFPEIVHLSKTFEEGGRNFTVYFDTDAKKCDATFSMGEKKIHFDIKGRDDANNTDHGVFEIWIPHILLSGSYSLLVDGMPTNFEEYVLTPNHCQICDPNYTNSTGSLLQFNYTKSATSIDILGKTAFPEFGPAKLTVMTFSIAILVVLSRKQPRFR